MLPNYDKDLGLCAPEIQRVHSGVAHSEILRGDTLVLGTPAIRGILWNSLNSSRTKGKEGYTLLFLQQEETAQV